jgi:nicotinamide-nucleotide amidase
MINAAIISTGSEILQGLYPDTNAQWLARRLFALGLNVRLIAACPDSLDEIESRLRYAAERVDLIVCTGGIGPTEDDLNRFAIRDVFGTPLERDEESLAMILERFTRRGREVPAGNDVQVLIPRGATVLRNQWGTAPGFFLPNAAERHAATPDDLQLADASYPNAALLALPGPPSEMRPMWETLAEPLIAARATGDAFTAVRSIRAFGRPESELNDLIKPMFRRDPDVDFTILARNGTIEFRIAARSTSADALEARLDEYEQELRQRIPESCIFGRNEDTLWSVVSDLLREHKQTVAVAESCTGGLLGKLLTDTPGSSANFLGGFITYSNEAKIRDLGVPEELIETHGAVSEEVAIAMANGARARTGSMHALAITGIAGPDGGTEEKPVGLTFVALASEGHRTIPRRTIFPGNRDQNRLWAAMTALDLLRARILGDAARQRKRNAR